MRGRAPFVSLFWTITLLVIPEDFVARGLLAAPSIGDRPPNTFAQKKENSAREDPLISRPDTGPKKTLQTDQTPIAQKGRRSTLTGGSVALAATGKASEKAAFPEPLPKRVLLLTEEETEKCACAQTDTSQGVPEIVSKPISIKFGTLGGESNSTAPKTANTATYRVLVLGDSLGLCGFGKALDSKLRQNENVSLVATYMACGTIPSSWLKIGPYSSAKTACGYWSIETRAGSSPAENKDTYGMTAGHKPASHPVPKIEALLERYNPDILVMQNGTNLLSLFSDGSTVIPSRHDQQLRSHLAPFLKCVTNPSCSLKKIYWVAPPVSGRYSKEAQDFLVEKLSLYGSPIWRVMDSRELVSYPYRFPMPDKEHFIGKEMEIWAQKIYDKIANDISDGAIPSIPLSKHELPAAFKELHPAAPSTADAGARKQIRVRAKLLSKSPPLTKEQILPYQESLVGYVYAIEDVLSGEYTDKEILVMHPAHIRLKEEQLDKYATGESYTLNLVDFEGSIWESIKRSDSTGRLELLPFIQKEDEARAPGAKR
jgi:hypothetical protein